MADLVQHMLTDHDPHPRLFDTLRDALAKLDLTNRHGHTLLAWTWVLLCETGFKPQLDRDAETGEPLPRQAPTLAFSATAGGVVADTGGADRWRVRRETVELLRRVAAGQAPEGSPDRANRLLACYIRALLGREPNSMRWIYPDLD